MTAPDVRTAARQEAFTNLYSHKPVPDRYDADLLIAGFIDGAVWGAALVTPTREQIAEALWEFPENGISLTSLNELAELGEGDYCAIRDYVYAQADAALVLIARNVSPRVESPNAALQGSHLVARRRHRSDG